MKRLLRPLFLLVLLVLLVPTTALAQQGAADHPLLALLAAVPAPTSAAEAEDLRFLDYLDMRASERALGAVTPESWQAFEALDDTERARWFTAAGRWSTLSTQYPGSYSSFGEETSELLGFDPFEVDRLLAFGQPPATALLLQGRFDPEAILASHHARGYAIFDEMGIGSLLLRRADGVDDLKLDLTDRNPANPFGGQFGRKEPLAILSDTLLANSPAWERIVALAETFEGERPSLLGNDDYRAAAEAIVLSEAAPELLIQAEFMSPAEFVGGLDPLLAITLRDLPAEELERIAAELLIGPLPPYSLLVLADAHDGDEQLALIGLVYPDPEAAAAARPVLEARVVALSNLPTEGPEEPFLTLVEGRLENTVIYDAGGRSVLVVGVRYPQVAAQGVPGGGRPEPSGGCTGYG